MGDVADMMLDGTLCEICGGIFDDLDSPGYPRKCETCKGADGLVRFVASLPDSVSLEWANSRYEKPEDAEDPEKVPECISIGISFSEGGFGFGSIGLLQTRKGLFLDTEHMSLARVKKYIERLIDSAITDLDQDPERHRLYNEERGRRCNDECEACKAGKNL